MVGHDGDLSEALPPLEFGYTRFAPQERLPADQSGDRCHAPRSLADRDFEMVDLFGNGLPDIVQMNGSVRFWRNLGGGMFDCRRTMSEVPAGVHLSDPGVQFADMNGDGRADLLVMDRQRRLLPAELRGSMERARLRPVPQARPP